MLFFRVILAPHPRRPFIARRFTLPVNVLTDRCPRTIEAPVMERISRQPRASRGVELALLQALPLPRCVLTALRCFIFSKSFICNIYAKPGGGVFSPFWNYSSTDHESQITHRRPAPILSGSPVMRSSVKAILLLFLHKTYNLQLRTETSLHVQRLQLGIHKERIIELRHFTPALAENRKEARRKRFVPFHG